MLNFTELLNKPVQGEIPEGKYRAKLVRIPENGKDRSKGYDGPDAHPDDIDEKDFIRFTYEIEVDGKKRIITDIKNERGIAIMTSHVRRQYNRQDETVTLGELVQDMLEGVDIYISRPTVQTANGLRKVNNVDFVPPLTKDVPSDQKNGTASTDVVSNSVTPAENNVTLDADGNTLPF